MVNKSAGAVNVTQEAKRTTRNIYVMNHEYVENVNMVNSNFLISYTLSSALFVRGASHSFISARLVKEPNLKLVII